MNAETDQPDSSGWAWLAMPLSLAITLYALMFGLLIGVALEDEPDAGATPPTATQPPGTTGGAEVFVSAGCGGCHTLSAAGATGAVGPNLDETQLSTDEIAAVVADGRGTAMPAFADRLSADEIAGVAAYVSESARSP